MLEQYEVSKLTLDPSGGKVLLTKGFVESLDVLKSLQQRMMYLGFMQATFNSAQRVGSTPSRCCKRVARIGCRSVRWLLMSLPIRSGEQIDRRAGAIKLASFLEFRKQVAPGHYQLGLLEFAASHPEAADLLNEEVTEIRFLAA